MSDGPETSGAAAPVIHQSAVVGEAAQIGVGTRVWHFCHVMDNAIVGSDSVLGHCCFVASGAVIGDRVRVQNHVSIYDGIVIEDDAFLGPSCVFTNVKNPRAEVNRKDAYLRTVIERGATIGANATIVCGVRVGQYAFVGAGAVVTHDVAPHRLALGVPAREVGWVCPCGEVAQSPPEAREGGWFCPHRDRVFAER